MSAIKAALTTGLFIFGILEFLHGFSQAFVFAGGIVALLTFLFLFSAVTIFTRIVSLILCTAGLLALFSTIKSNWHQLFSFVEGFGEMAPLVSLAVAVTFLGLPLRIGEYAELFQRLYKKSRSLYRPYLVSLLISYFLSFMAILGSIAPSFHLVEQNLRKIGVKPEPRFVSTSIMRAYVLAIFISPVAATNGIARNYSGLSWTELLGPASLLSLAGLAVVLILETPKIKSNPQEKLKFAQFETGCLSGYNDKVAVSRSLNDKLIKKLFSFILLFICILGSIILLGDVLSFSALNSISLGCLLALLVWGVLTGYLKTIVDYIINFLQRDIVNLSEQVILFIAAGFFTYSLEESGWLTWIGYFLEGAADEFGAAAVLSLVPVVIVMLAVAGLHPLASGIVIARAFTASQYYFEPLGIAVSLMGGMSMAFIISPFSALILMVSAWTKQSPYKLSLNWNFVFVLIFLSIVAVYLSFMPGL